MKTTTRSLEESATSAAAHCQQQADKAAHARRAIELDVALRQQRDTEQGRLLDEVQGQADTAQQELGETHARAQKASSSNRGMLIC